MEQRVLRGYLALSILEQGEEFHDEDERGSSPCIQPSMGVPNANYPASDTDRALHNRILFRADEFASSEQDPEPSEDSASKI